MRPVKIPKSILSILNASFSRQEKIELIKASYQQLRKEGAPEVSVIIPAYNEGKSILTTLQSLAANVTRRRVEIIVVNNNSTDDTEALVKATGITCIHESRQGITAARNAGLQAASGKFIVNADADAVYPAEWINEMVKPLTKTKVALTYGRFSFVPVGNTSRFVYFFYEHAADMLRNINRSYREEAVNVYGFNSAYRRSEGLQVGGYNHPIGANEDGYLALKLRDRGFGKLHFVKTKKAMVWTTDRRIQIEGGFIKGVMKRFGKVVFPQIFTQLRTDL